jgi:putative ABC transport system permease protein
MLRNYFRVFFRNIRRNSFFTFLNVLGLTLGIGVSFVIILYVTDELSYDQFHEDGELIHKVALSGILSGNKFEGVNTCAPISAALSTEVPGIQSSTRVSGWGDLMIHKDDNIVMQEDVIVADSNFFKFFTFELIAGGIDKLLVSPKSLVLTLTTAKKYFGDMRPEEVVGQTMIIGNDKESYQVTGVAADPPQNTHIDFDAIVSMETWEYSRRKQWTSNSLYTYFKVFPGTDIQLVQVALDGFVEKYVGPEIQQYLGISLDDFRDGGGDYGYFTIPLHDIHFADLDGEMGPRGNRQNVLIFSIVAFFVLIIAAVNFINLSTAKATDRAKEIGIRKSVGAYRNQLIYQFLFESVFLVFLSSLIAMGLVMISLGYLNDLMNKQFVITELIDLKIIAYYIAAIILIGILAGLYPSLVLSSYRPAAVIKGKPHSTHTSSFNPRNILVGFQFTLTAMAIILTLVISRQLDHMRSRELGFQKEQLLAIDNARSLPNQETFKNELNALSSVRNVSLTYNYPPRVYSNSVFRIDDTNDDILFYQYYADEDHAASIGLEMVQGRFFEDPNLDENSVIINETGFKQTGWTSMDDKRILEIDDEGFKTFHVVGVVKDFQFQDFKTEIQPLLMFCSKDGRYITMQVEGQDAIGTIRTIEESWMEFTGGKPFNYTFVDQQFERLFQTEERLANLTILFSVLTIITASLGLFGLAAFVARSRRKEFGIRKILGAHESLIWFLQFRYFVSIAGVALLVAIPAAYYLTDIWLDEFVYRITNGLSIYLLSIVAVVVIILVSVGYQSIKASKVSPAKVLRDE